MSWRKGTATWFYLSCVMLFWMKPVKGGNGFRPFFFLSNLAGLKRGRNHRAENNRPWLSTFDSLMHWSISFSIDCRMKCTSDASMNRNNRLGPLPQFPELFAVRILCPLCHCQVNGAGRRSCPRDGTRLSIDFTMATTCRRPWNVKTLG